MTDPVAVERSNVIVREVDNPRRSRRVNTARQSSDTVVGENDCSQMVEAKQQPRVKLQQSVVLEK